jgi:hypothetical protein
MAIETRIDLVGTGSLAREIAELRARLDPRSNRAEVAERYDALFRTGSVPDPAPDGFLPGTLEMTTTFGALDAYGRWMSRLWMPWMGKRFDASTSTGINRLVPSARVSMRVMWPAHTPKAADGDAIEAFPFRTRVEPGALDPGSSVLVIDYDFEDNPAFIIRKIRDELVQIADGFYLGKVLMCLRAGYRRIGFFSLRRP